MNRINIIVVDSEKKELHSYLQVHVINATLSVNIAYFYTIINQGNR